MTGSKRYLANPDVALREEDQDGALLFNPDTDQIRVLNATGLFIWKLCDGRHELPEMVAAMREAFDKVPEDEVTSQVTQFVEEMASSGFLGTVVE
jgi:hypothetical protein